VAACGQAASILIAHFHFKLELPWIALMGILMATVATNHWFQDSANWSPRKVSRKLATVIVMDLLLLTLILYFTGGRHNPFISFYLLLVSFGAMSLAARPLMVVLAVGLACLAFVSFKFVPFRGPPTVVSEGRLVYPLFIGSWILALVLTGGCIAFFLHHMNASLRMRDLALADAGKRIEEANRYQSLATLAAGVAHELGSPLGTIAVASKDLIRELERSDEGLHLRDDAMLIRSEVERCRVILKRIDRDSTRSLGEPMRRVTVDDILGGLTSLLSPPVFGRLDITDQTSGRAFMTSVDAVLQSLVVLIENAAEADTTGKKIRVEIQTVDERLLSFRIVDSGAGMTDAERRRLGEPFYTTKQKKSGMGLGVYLVKTLAANLGGSCDFHPNPSGGTSAIFRIPLDSPGNSPT
jgi:two-component system sensor histidine kinase RegB